MSIPTSKSWTAAADGYVNSIARLTANIVNVLIPRTSEYHPISAESYVLDNCTGTGTVTAALCRLHPNARILATDTSLGMLEQFASQVGTGNYTTQHVDALHLAEHLGTSIFSHAFCTFALSFIDPPLDAVKQMHSVLKADGVASVAVWGYPSDPLTIFEKAAQAVDPTYKLIDPSSNKNPIRDHHDLASIMTAGGFKDVVSGTQDFSFAHANAGAYADYFFRANNPVSLKLISSFGGSVDELEKALRRVVYEEYADGKEIYFIVNYAMGRK